MHLIYAKEMASDPKPGQRTTGSLHICRVWLSPRESLVPEGFGHGIFYAYPF